MRFFSLPNISIAGLSEVPLEAVENAKEAKVQAVDLSKNNFDAFPEVMNAVLNSINHERILCIE